MSFICNLGTLQTPIFCPPGRATCTAPPASPPTTWPAARYVNRSLFIQWTHSTPDNRTPDVCGGPKPGPGEDDHTDRCTLQVWGQGLHRGGPIIHCRRYRKIIGYKREYPLSAISSSGSFPTKPIAARESLQVTNQGQTRPSHHLIGLQELYVIVQFLENCMAVF